MAPPGDDLLPPSRPRAKPVSVRFDEDMLGRLKALAARRGTRYQTLLKQFIAERLYEEERHEGPPAGRLHGSSSTPSDGRTARAMALGDIVTDLLRPYCR